MNVVQYLECGFVAGCNAPLNRQKNHNMEGLDINVIFGYVTAAVQLSLAIMILFLHPGRCSVCGKQRLARLLLVLSLLISMAGNLAHALFTVPKMAFDVFFFWSCSTQNILMGFVSILFANPKRISVRFVWLNCLAYIFFNLALIASALFFPTAFTAVFISGFVAGIGQSIYICRVAVREYRTATALLEEYYAEDFNYMLRYQNRFIAAIAVGMALLVAVPFMADAFYVWRMLFIAFYIYVAILFIDQSYNMDLVSQLYDRLDVENRHPKEASGSMDRLGVAIKKWVDKKNYVISDVSTESIAESLDTDIYTFREYFRQVVGEDFRTWRQRLRIEEACRIMTENPSMSYEIVAETVGINDRSNFKKSFLKFKGVSPNEWKRANTLTLSALQASR